MTLAHRIGVMESGRLVQVAPPRELYEAPNSTWIAGFVGDVNLIEGRIAARGADGITVATDSAGALVAAQAAQAPDAPVVVALRPEKIRLSATAPDGAANALAGEVVEAGFLGGVTVYRVKLASGAVLRVSCVNASRGEEGFAAGARVALSFAPSDCVVLDR